MKQNVGKNVLIILFCTIFLQTQIQALSMYEYYISMKSIILSSYYLTRLSEQDYELTILQCNQCSYLATPAKLYGWLLGGQQFIMVQLFQKILCTKSHLKVRKFMMKIYTEQEISCPVCGSYKGWFLKQ